MGKKIFDIIMSERDSRSNGKRDYYNNYNYRGERLKNEDMMMNERMDMRSDMRGDMRMRDSNGRYASDYARGRDMSYDRTYGMDGHSSENHYLSREDMMKWKNKVGEHFSEMRILPYLEREKIDFSMKDYTKDEFILLVNVMYSDYKSIFGEDPYKYVEMAKCFLEDKDSTIKGGEKLCAYYCVFVCDDE